MCISLWMFYVKKRENVCNIKIIPLYFESLLIYLCFEKLFNKFVDVTMVTVSSERNRNPPLSVLKMKISSCYCWDNLFYLFIWHFLYGLLCRPGFFPLHGKVCGQLDDRSDFWIISVLRDSIRTNRYFNWIPDGEPTQGSLTCKNWNTTLWSLIRFDLKKVNHWAIFFWSHRILTFFWTHRIGLWNCNTII